MYESIAEQKIRQAIDEGLFENLRNNGKPLRLGGDEHVPEHERIGLHLLRENGFLPEWLELRRQVYYGRSRVIEARENWQAVTSVRGRAHALTRRAGEEYRKCAGEINALIDLHNIRCPMILLELTRFREDWQPAGD